MKSMFVLLSLVLSFGAVAAQLSDLTGNYHLVGAGSDNDCSAEIALAYKSDGNPLHCFTLQVGPRLEITVPGDQKNSFNLTRAGRCLNQGRHGRVDGGNFLKNYLEETTSKITKETVEVNYRYGEKTFILPSSWYLSRRTKLEIAFSRQTLSERKTGERRAHLCVYSKP